MTFDASRRAAENGARATKEEEEEKLSEGMKKLALLGVKPEALNAIKKEETGGGPDAKEPLKRLDELYRGDIILAIFTSQLSLLHDLVVHSSNTAVISLVTVQRVGNVLYAQLSLRLKDVKVEGRPLSEFYITRELIVISTPDGAYVVHTNVPTQDPSRRAQTFAAVTAWLNDFRIVIP